MAGSGALEMHPLKETPTLSVMLSNYKGVQYHAPVTVGGQSLPAIYDTGSFEVIAVSELCDSCDSGVPVYDQAKSSTFQPGDQEVGMHHFGSGSVKGKKGLETIRLGPPTSPLVAAPMPFWQVLDHNIEVLNAQASFSAIVGLSHKVHVPEEDGSSDLTLLERTGVNEFAFCLERGHTEAPGWLMMGSEVAAAKAHSSTKSLKVVGNIHWGVKGTRFAPGLAAWEPCNPSCGVIVDSGTSLIAASEQVIKSMQHALSQVKEDCSNVADMPDLQFDLDGQTFSVPPAAYIVQVDTPVIEIGSIWDLLWFRPTLTTRTACVPAFIKMGHDTVTQFGPLIILGMPFLKYHYTIFDRPAKRLHVVPSTPECKIANGLAISGAVVLNAAGHLRARPADEEPTTLNASALRVPTYARVGGFRLI